MGQIRGEKPALLIAGPTASGKSAVALALAGQFDGVVINADAMQVYADLRVLTARPSAGEEAMAPHRLYGMRDGAEPFSAAQWCAAAMTEIERAWAQAKLPIVVGGTGLYLRTLLIGLADVPPIPDDLRAGVRALSTPELAQALAREDPVMAERLNAGDRQRQSRALEVIRATGQSLADWQLQQVPGPLLRAGASPLLKVCLLPDRAEVYRRCDARFAAMMDSGALDEVATLVARGLPADAPVMKAVGVPELAACLCGQLAASDAVAAAQQATRRYAKRQFTWLRNQFGDWTKLQAQQTEDLIAEIAIKLQNMGLTTQC